MENKSMSETIINAIISFVAAKREEKELRTNFPNALLREDVLALLNNYCTVVYFPLRGETNNGFHITGIPTRKGTVKHFVYINTAQTIEKQVFTAAHELGHVWKVDEFIKEQCNIAMDSDLGEMIINRFAAELLMPADQFLMFFLKAFDNYKTENGQLTVINMLKIISLLMCHFFVPRKSVVYRLGELEIISEENVNRLLGNADISEKEIDEYINKLLLDAGQTRFLFPEGKKCIDGLAELLDKAEEQKTLPKSKITNLRDIFELPNSPLTNGQLSEMVDVISKEEET